MRHLAAADVFSLREVAAAAGVPVRSVRDLTGSGQVLALGEFLPAVEAVRCVRLLRRRPVSFQDRVLFSSPSGGVRSTTAGITASSLIHAGVLGILVLLTFGLSSGEPKRTPSDPVRLVFLATPGPGGGGGGGGMRQPAPPARAEMRTASARVQSPVPPPKPMSTRKPEPRRRTPPAPVLRPTPRPVDPPPPPPRPSLAPQVVAPVVTEAADPRDRAGVLTDSAKDSESQGPGAGSGAGTGQGTGIGEGTGTGIGPGSGGGTGGGPYRPGSGISPPGLLREVRPEYTEEARRRGITGDVLLEIVVRDDGSVGDVKVLQALGGGLDRRAIDAVKQWRFSPARRHGTPVDVVVEVAVEFKLR